MVEQSESEERRPEPEARNEPTRRDSFRAGVPQRALDARRGDDTMTTPNGLPNCVP